MGLLSLLCNRRMFMITLLGFSSGLPLALTSSTLQAWFTQAGIDLVTIGTLSLIGLPYVWKFLWSPLIDRFSLPFLGGRRGWIAATQIGLCILLLVLAQLSPELYAHKMAMIAVGIAFFSATQDIAIDAYRTDTLLPNERGMGSAWFIFAARIALLVGGGLALILADHIGWRLTYQLMAVLLGMSVLITYFAPEVVAPKQIAKSFWATFADPFKELLQREAIIGILLFIVLYKIGDALALSLMSAFLLRDLGFTLTDVGFAYKTLGLLASILGAFVGGGLLTRLNLFKALLWFGLAQAFSNLLFMVLAIVGKQYSLMITAIFVEQFCSGMSSTALVVLLTSLCHRQYSAAQFACLSALSAIGRVFLGPLAGWMVEHTGWAHFYAWTFWLCMPSLLLLILLKRKVIFHVEAIA